MPAHDLAFTRLDPKLVEYGRWFLYPENHPTDTRFLLRSVKSEAAAFVVEDSNNFAEAYHNRKALAKVLVRDWAEVYVDGELLPYSKENLSKLVDDERYEPLVRWMVHCATDISNYTETSVGEYDE